MKYKIGDKVIIKPSEYHWRQPWVGKIGVICGRGESYMYRISFEKYVLWNTYWNEDDIALFVETGEQLLFNFAKE